MEADKKTEGEERPEQALPYSAIIRVNRCDGLLREMVSALNQQTLPPVEILLIDSSRSISTGAELSEIGRVVTYPYPEFNYADALNVGVAVANQPWCLIVSSHVLLDDAGILERGWKEAKTRGIRAITWLRSEPVAVLPEQKAPSPSFEIINRSGFIGRNGISNSCAMIATNLMRDRPFRREVFSAEDQEWTGAYLRSGDVGIMRIAGEPVRYANPHHNDDSLNLLKLANEEIAIAYYVRRRLLWPDVVVGRCVRAAIARLRGRPERAKLHMMIARGVMHAWIRPPQQRSAYY